MVVEDEPDVLEETLINETNLSLFEATPVNSPSIRSKKAAAVRFSMFIPHHGLGLYNQAECLKAKILVRSFLSVLINILCNLYHW